MSRISDTRLRTREAAARLVAGGHCPHGLTVDLIYAEIRQGSRTTINDELKLWKDEQTKIDALNSVLPSEVANAMLSVWATAIEYGAKTFDQRREEIEKELLTAQKQIEDLVQAIQKAQMEIRHLTEQFEFQQAELTTARQNIIDERTQKEAALIRAADFVQQIESLHVQHEKVLAETKIQHQQRVTEMQLMLASQEQTFREEIGKATTRLESVQKHIMLQVEQARDAHRQIELQLSKANQKNEQFSAEIQTAKAHIASLAQLESQAQIKVKKIANEMAMLRNERDTLTQQLALSNGKLNAKAEQIKSLEEQLMKAEVRVQEVLQQTIWGSGFIC